MDRPVKALVLPPGPRLHHAVGEALDGGGPAVCPLSPDLPRPALRAMLEALRPAMVETAGGTTPFRGGSIDARPVTGRGHNRHNRRDGSVAGDIAVLIATSGSTGQPKIVELSGAALRHSATATLRRLGAAPGDRWLCVLPTSHIAGIQVLVRSIVAGVAPVFPPGSADAPAAVEYLAVVPTQLRRMTDAGADLSAYKAILLGGAAPPPGLLTAARSAGARIVTTYGMSETCGGCVYDGVPLDEVEVGITDDGRIRLAGPVLFSRYRGRPDITASARDGRWFLTQDLGRLENGRLRVLGRADDVIITGGEKVVAAEVADALARHPGVADVAVVGRPDAEWGERVTAVVVPRGAPPSLDDLRAWVKSRMPAYAAPRELELREAIPLLRSGKPDRERLRRTGALP